MSITLNEFISLKPGDKVRIKEIDGGRPKHWGNMGSMDKYAGQVVTILEIFIDREQFRIREDCFWYWYKSDIDSIIVAPEIPKPYTPYIFASRGSGKTLTCKDILNTAYGTFAFNDSCIRLSFQIDKVIFNDPATIVFWKDDTKTVVKAGNDEYFDKEKGLAMAISKKVLGNKGNYYNTFKKHGAIDTDKEIYIPLSLLKECTTLKKMKELIKYMEGKI